MRGARAVLGLLAGLSLCACQGAGRADDAPSRAGTPPDPAGESGESSPTTAAGAHEQAEAAEPEVMPLEEWNRRWTELLREAVSRQTGLVDYRRMARRREELRELVAALGPRRDLSGGGDELLALLINAHNALVVAAVVDEWPISSVRDVTGFFNRRRYRVLGRAVTLNELRDVMIRPRGDPRVHAALVFGAMGSPPLRTAAYTADRLDRQLNDQAWRFVNSPVHNTALGRQAMLSPIFEWFADDFEAEPYGGALGFLRLYSDPAGPLGRLLRSDERPLLTYFDFNWALNDGR